MGCYFIVSVQIDNPDKRPLYDEYIRQVKPLVESFGGEYLIRSEKIEYWPGPWCPDRIIVIRFADRESLDRCFSSPEYREIATLRIESVTAGAIIVEGQ